LPRGQVFFTGNTAPTAAEAGSKTSAARTKRANTKGGTIKVESTRDEVIVGELDDGGVGQAAMAEEDKKKKASSRQYPAKPDAATSTDLSREEKPSAKTTLVTFAMSETYESESSDDEDMRSHTQQTTSTTNIVQPTRLPFPPGPVPVGVGASERPLLYDYSSPVRIDAASPFVDHSNLAEKQREQESWFLFQFPTRLPISKTVARPIVAPPVVVSSTGADEMGVPNTVHSASEVSTPATIPGSFDNVLSSASGHLGKLLVYKSGKTVLQIGSNRLLVSEGLPCGFVQQAVCIDTEKELYIPLGNVGKTVVVTPDIQAAFTDESR
jgi:hypothetical protein